MTSTEIKCQACDYSAPDVKAGMVHAREGHTLTGLIRDGVTVTISVDDDDDEDELYEFDDWDAEDQ
jgi:hypothetical protein